MPTNNTISREAAMNRAALTVAEFSSLMGISVKSIRRYIRANELEHQTIGKRVVIPYNVYAPMIQGGE